jgi:aromatic ring-cleaving dioxygenase
MHLHVYILIDFHTASLHTHIYFDSIDQCSNTHARESAHVS